LDRDFIGQTCFENAHQLPSTRYLGWVKLHPPNHGVYSGQRR
jgi:hypothetical protein